MTTDTPPPELRRTPSRRNRPFPLVIGLLSLRRSEVK